MKRSVWLWELMGFAAVSVSGTLLHFLYEWSGEAIWIAPFSGVNESTFEHMKLFFWPMLFYAIFESFFFKDYKSFWCVKLRGILRGLVLIPVLFYTYGGVIGKSPDWVNISIFFIAAASAFIYETKLLYSERPLCKHPERAKAAITAIALLFIIFTFFTPILELFRDPTTGAYGI